MVVCKKGLKYYFWVIFVLFEDENIFVQFLH